MSWIVRVFQNFERGIIIVLLRTTLKKFDTSRMSTLVVSTTLSPPKLSPKFRRQNGPLALTPSNPIRIHTPSFSFLIRKFPLSQHLVLPQYTFLISKVQTMFLLKTTTPHNPTKINTRLFSFLIRKFARRGKAGVIQCTQTFLKVQTTTCS